MRVFENSVSFYRKTFKRVRPLHLALHRGLTGLLIPALERAKGFQTVPDDPFWFRLELLTGRHEAETRAQLQHLVQPGMVALDIGAHVGYYARLLAGLVGDAGRVIAFEPHPRTHQVLARNLAGRDNVTLKALALSDERGTAELYDYLMMSASGSLHYDEAMRDLQRAQRHEDDIAPRIDGDFTMETFTVTTVPGDELLAELGLERVDFIKMDIEGAEIQALRGLRGTIARSPGLKLIMEYNPQALQAFGHDPAEALREVRAMGFASVHSLEPDGTLRELSVDANAFDALTARLMAHMGVVNLLLVREDI